MIGRTISHYKILSKLGEGGMGVVYKAQDLKLSRFVALKFLPHSTGDENARRRFIHEAQAASSLDHPNICSIHEIDETPEGQLFIVMPCYEGESLQARIERGPLKLDEALDIAIQTASGLSKAHEKGIVHRDIKAGNVFITNDGHAKIVDFGLAKLATQAKLTRSGASVGTVMYMSPEQVQGDEADRRSDIWSLGVVLYEMITGRLPFEGEHEAAVLYSIINKAPKPPTAVRTGVPMELERIIDKCMAKKPEERYQHAEDLLVDLKEIRSGLAAGRDTSRSRPLKAPAAASGRKRIWIPVILIAAVALAFFFLRPLIFGEAPVAAPKPIAVISFENQTGDDSYDYLQEVIPNLLITHLEQSKYLKVVTWERLHDLLNQRGGGSAKLIDKDMGFDLCRMDGIDTIVLGSFSMAGDVFVTDVKVLDVESKQLLKSASAKGVGVGSILESQIDDLGRNISRGIGLSDRAVAAAERPVTEVTTHSMDAYHYFVKGRDGYSNRRWIDAWDYLEKAVRLDSTFAVAWLYLGRTYQRLRDPKAADDAFARAKRLAASTPEKDRLYIDAIYASVIEKNDRKYAELLHELVRKYPQEKLAHVQMADYHRSHGRFEEAIACYEKALALDPEYAEALNGLAYVYVQLEDYPSALEHFDRYAAASPGELNPFDSMAETYFRMGDLEKAAELYKKTSEIRPEFGAQLVLSYIAALEEDYTGAIEWIDHFIDAAPAAGIRGFGTLARAGFCLYGCRWNEAIDAAQKARGIFQEMGNVSAVGDAWGSEGYTRYQRGEHERARMCYTECASLLNEAGLSSLWSDVVSAFALGLVDIKEANLDAAGERLAEIKTILPEIAEDDPVRSRMAQNYALQLEGEILLAEGRADDAVEICTKRIDLPTPMTQSDMILYNIPPERDVLARAYVAKGAIDDAIAEYERLVTFDPKSRDRRLVYPVLRYRLARLYEESGRSPEAAREYERFLEICEGADEDIFEIGDARVRLGRLAAVNPK